MPIKPGLALTIIGITFLGALATVLTNYVSTSNTQTASTINSSPSPAYQTNTSPQPTPIQNDIFAGQAEPAPVPGDTTPPSPPSNLTITPSKLTPITTLSWKASTDDSGKRVIYHILVDGTDTGITTFQTLASLPNLLGGSTHTFTVIAMDPSGNTSRASLTTTIPVASTAFSSGARVQSNGTLNVRNSYGTSGTTILAQVTNGTPGTILADAPVMSKETWWHVAFDAYQGKPAVTGWSVESGLLPFVPMTHTLTLTQPSNGLLTATDGTVGDPVLSCGTTTGGTITSVCTGIYPNNSQVTVTALPIAGNYISAWTGACAGNLAAYCQVNMTSDRNVGVTFQSIPIPTGVSATANNSTSVTVNWTGAPAVNSYTVYRNGTTIANNIIPTTFTDNTVQANTTYNYSVAANINGTRGTQSAPAPVTTPGGTTAAGGTVLAANTVGSPSADDGRAVAVDNGSASRNGAVIVGGVFNNVPYVAKYSADYTTQLWSVTGIVGGTGATQAIAVDSQGNIYATGYFGTSQNFGCQTLTSVASYDIFLVKFSPTGSCIWSKSYGSANTNPLLQEGGYAIALDGSGNVIISGKEFGPLDFGKGVIGTQYGGIFVAKFDSSGNNLWAKEYSQINPPGSGEGASNALVVDTSNNIYTAGYYKGPYNFGSGQLTPQNASGDLFVMKLDPSGTQAWFKDVSYPKTVLSNAPVVTGLTLDMDGNLWVVGNFFAKISFNGVDCVQKPTDPSCLAYHSTSFTSFADIFLAKYKPDGTYINAFSFGTTRTDTGAAITADSDGHVSIVGLMGDGTLNFGCGAFSPINGVVNIYETQLNLDGTCRWSKNFGVGFGAVNNVAADSASNLHVVGTFSSSVNLGNVTPYNFTSTIGPNAVGGFGYTSDIFLQKVKGI